MFLRAYKDVRQWYNVNITTAGVYVNESEANFTITAMNKTMYVVIGSGSKPVSYTHLSQLGAVGKQPQTAFRT